MAKLISQLCGELQPAVCSCLPRGLTRSHLKVTRADTRGRLTSDKPQKKATGKVARATFSVNT